MRIAVWHNLPSGGGKRALHDHVRGLLARGHTVEAWCPPTADRAFLPLADLVRERVVPLDWPAGPRPGERYGLTPAVARGLAAMDAHCAACAAEIEAAGFDVLFANSCTFFRSTPIGRLCALPSVLYLQEPYRWLYEALPRLPWLAPPPGGRMGLRRARAAFVDWRELRNKRVQAREELRNASAFGRILVNSRFSRESVLRSYGLDADVCYLGVDARRFPAPAGPRADVLVGLGSITPEKNLALPIEAVARLAPPRPRLVWIGNVASAPYRAEMEHLAARLGVDLDIRVGLPEPEVHALLGSAAMMVYAPRLEPFGLAPLEANACGTPVVAVAEGGMRETVEDGVNGLLVDADPGAMAAAVARLRAAPDLAARLGRRGRRLVEDRWSLEGAAERLESGLARAISAARPPADTRPPPACHGRAIC